MVYEPGDIAQVTEPDHCRCYSAEYFQGEGLFGNEPKGEKRVDHDRIEENGYEYGEGYVPGDEEDDEENGKTDKHGPRMNGCQYSAQYGDPFSPFESEKQREYVS